VGLSPPLFFILAGKSKFEERRKRGKNYQKTDGPQTDDTTISASTNKMKLVRFYYPAIAASEHMNRQLWQRHRMVHIVADAVTLP
jgi:hypothetical protein